MTRAEVGLGIQSDKPLDDYAAIAQLAERLGIDVLSVYGDLGFQPPIVALTVAARATRNLRLGPACLNPYSLTPIEIAGQIAALDLASNGRAYLGLARGTWLDAVGIEQPRPLTTLREAIAVISRVLRRDDRGFAGDVFQLEPGFALHYEPLRPDPPLMLGTWGPRTAALAGELAQEIKIGGSANPAVVPWVQQHLATGASRSGRHVDEVRIVVGAVSVVDEDGLAARRLARREVAMYVAVVADLDPTLEVDDELLSRIRRHVEAGEDDDAGALIPDDLLDRFAFAGTPEQVAGQAAALFDAGASRVEFGTPHGLTFRSGIELIGDRVLPLLR